MHLRWVITIKSYIFLSTKTKSILKVRKNGQQKTYNLFCNIAANELNIDVARYKTCHATNHVVYRFERGW